MPQPPVEVYGIPIKEIARLCAVSEKTATRWKDGTSCPPETALMILRADLGCLSPYWLGWTIRGEEIVSPEGWSIRRDHVLAVPLLYQRIAAYEAADRVARGLDDQASITDDPTAVLANLRA